MLAGVRGVRTDEGRAQRHWSLYRIRLVRLVLLVRPAASVCCAKEIFLIIELLARYSPVGRTLGNLWRIGPDDVRSFNVRSLRLMCAE